MTRFIITLVISIQGLSTKAQHYFLNGNKVDSELRLSGTNPATGTAYCDGEPCYGLLTEMDSSGLLVSKSNYRNGKRDGSYETFYPSGLTKSLGRMINNFNVGIHIEFYETGMIKSIEHFPKEQHGILDGTEKISFYENGKVETKYAYNPGWIPIFHYEFSETGDTLMKIEPLQQDSTIFEITEFQGNKKVSEKLFKLNEEGQRKFITEEN